jgi:serine/threonine protein phosphatase PrpC
MTPATPRFFSAASTETGFVRENNEDRVYADDARGIFLVVDGMGGHEAGEHAADIAVERIRARLERQTGAVEQRIREAITLANNAIYRAAQTTPEWKGMACVLTVAVIDDGKITVGHVGDSRLYRIRRGLIEKITHDHSPVGEREDSGAITEAEAMRHPRRNEVFRDVGSQEHAPDDEDFIEIQQIPYEQSCAYLLCSDGLSDVIPSRDILRIVEQHAGDRWAAVRALVSAATETGKDNVSAVLIEGEQFAASFGRRAARSPAADGEETGRLAPAPARRAWYIVPALLLLGAIIGAGLYFAYDGITRKPGVAPPQTIRVTAPNTIAAALEQAHPGDTVVVAAGAYAETIRLKTAVAVIAERPHEAVLTGPVIAEHVRDSRFEGFKLEAASVGIRILDSDVRLERNAISGARQAAIEWSGNSRGLVLACSIQDNPGAGISVTGASAPAILYNVIANNGKTRPPLPGIVVRSIEKPRIASNVFFGNGAEAVWLSQDDPRVAAENFFVTTMGRPDRRANVRTIGALGAQR